ncbi:hypothetical protein ACHHYP_13236 [Achlya hypogyna]|uniref:HTH myb-type domain-containing protein n=1 Tax=Achlya hypogyna TaxID=1202772 RepID=A0A1V9YFN7_ACHHY|nr:hypothetical protein ACHHYP_13236 [Achlya hypogyna]
MRTMHDSPLSSDGSESPRQVAQGLWTSAEHERFLMALRLFPEGPWKEVAEMIGTRNAKQAQAHMQKCKEKLYRRIRELQAKLEDDHSSSDSDSVDGHAPYRTQRTKHADTLGIPVLHPIPFDLEPSDSFLCREAHLWQAESGQELSIDESLDFLINEMKGYVEGE